MMQLTIKTKAHFSAAHFLEDYEGLCGSVHGHRWEVVLKVKLPKDNDTAMLVDFTDLKKGLEDICNQMDHSFILDSRGNQVSRDFYKLLKKHNMRMYQLDGRTTAENISQHIYNRVKDMTGWTTHSIEVYEAPNNAVTYKED